jgi:hypothetical protein
MPRYRYMCSKYHVTELWASRDSRKERVKCRECGAVAHQCPGAQVSRPSTWSEPVLSDALGVHPEQIKQAQEHSVRHGVPTEFTKDGRAILTSRQHRRDYARLLGYRDLDGGYGDP